MRIALIHYRLLRNGGLETRLFNYLKEFRRLGHEVTLVVSKIHPQVEIHPSVIIRQVDLKRVPKPLRMYFFDRALSKIIPSGSFDLSFSLGRTSNQDIVLCPGNHLGYLKAMRNRFWSPFDRLNIYLDRIAYRKSKIILACSSMMKQELIELYKTDATKIQVLLPPINTNKFRSPSLSEIEQAKKKYGISLNKKSLLFLTTGNERKGYPLLLDVMKTLTNDPIELVVAGVKPMSTSLPNVKYIGYSDKPQELLWACDGLVHPAKYEPFGQVITESIQCGTPVLISHMVGAKEIVDDKVGMVVNSFDIAEWRESVLNFIHFDFSLESNFAQQVGLSVEQHCEKILEYSNELNC